MKAGGQEMIDWTDAYNNMGHIPGGPDYPPRWMAEAAAFREAMLAGGRAELDIPYGEKPRNRFDLFRPESAAKGLLVFVHGGWWIAFDKSVWSHLAQGAVAAGWAVALPSYTLAPEARIGEITREIAQAITVAAPRIGGPILLAGHSAGGHLVTRMVCRDAPLSEAVLARIRRVTSISGLHDLRPLMKIAANEKLRIDAAEAQAESPALLEPLPDARVACAVGAEERPEFLRQNDLLANIWFGLEARTSSLHIPGCHHFNVVDGMKDRDSRLTRLILGEGE
ncbi:MAG: alpha/beta fold hydrolase [Methylobacterium sp.]|nr:alpha/beta fold hydrolase [Methylobacterium sp.]MCA3601263.1 alpha/beta fold hydrolase [Methylobacterium sp.]MCA3609966.1 alpha/beta fold hydrolase [Methylobacterium sp.]MCA3618015.1 alpha/beta fold hydrolase [Methylobacterium sp.]MCA3620294.1 alpha/beta fold hydrolase [Methylobacterium sp.]